MYIQQISTSSKISDLRIGLEKDREEIAKLHRDSTKVTIGKSIEKTVGENNSTDPELLRAIEALSQSIEDANTEIDRIKRTQRKESSKLQQKFQNSEKSVIKSFDCPFGLLSEFFRCFLLIETPISVITSSFYSDGKS